MLVIRPSKGVLECYQYEGNDEWDATNLDNEIFGSYLHKDLSAIPEGPNIGQVPDMDEIPPTVREITLMVRRLGSKNICVGENAGKVEEWETLVAFKLDGEIRLAENPEQLVGYFKSQGYTKMSGLETETIELKITGPEQIEKMLSQNKFIDFEGTDGQKAELELLGLDEAEKG